jgi:hypothetical protein
MTINIDIIVAGDLFVSNSVMELARVPGKCVELAGIRFETRVGASDSRDRVRRLCFDVAMQQLHDAWPQSSVWLFACYSAWQRKDKIFLHRRLWKSLEAASVVLPSGERTAEILVDNSRGARFFGVLRVPAEECERAYNVLAIEPESFIIASTTGSAPTLDEHVLGVWQRHQSELLRWAEIATAVCGDGRVLFRPFGFFDDVEVGVDVILEADLLQQWNSATM